MTKRNAFELLMKSATKSVKRVTDKPQQIRMFSQNAPSKDIVTKKAVPKNIVSEQESESYDYILQFDGGSRGNPGISGCGSVIYYRGNEIWNRSVYLGDKYTNNYAEYFGLIYGLIGANQLQIKDLKIEGDSQIIINQITGKFNVKSELLKPLHENAVKQLTLFHNVSVNHIYRDKNKRADELANIAMDSKTTQ